MQLALPHFRSLFAMADCDNFPVLLPKFNLFSVVVEQCCENKLLQQQSQALASLQQWFAPDSPSCNEIAMVSMPTGSGKTGVMCCLPYFLGRIGLQKNCNPRSPSGEPEYRFDKPVLVIAPSLDIADQLETQLFASDARGDTFLLTKKIIPKRRKRDVLPNGIKIEQTSDLGKVDKIERQDVIIANAQKFRNHNWVKELNDDSFRLVVVDEAHHFPAQTWLNIIDKFQGHALVVFFTATPYRGDGQPVLGEKTPIAYHLRLDDAVKQGIIRKTEFVELTGIDPLPEGVSVSEKKFSREDILDIRRNTMVLKEARLKQEEKDRCTPLPNQIPHMIIAIAKNCVMANQMLDIWQNIYPDCPAATYYSDLKKPEKDEVMRKLRNNELKLVVIVQMLLEGFDHPPISIAAILTKICSPVKFTQFVGRAQRICRASEGNEIGGTAHIVTHIDYEQQENYNQFIEERLIPDN